MPQAPFIGRPFSRLARASRLLFSWRAADLGVPSLDALTGQTATFVRASAGGAVLDRNGRLRTPVHSQPRFEMVDLDGDGVRETPAVLLERAATNLFTFSEAFDDASWGKTAVTVTANAATAPDGSSNADKLAEDATSNVHRLSRAYVPAVGDVLTLSVFAKAGERSWIKVSMDNYGGAFPASRAAWFNLATGQIGTQLAGSNATIVALGNGLYRCSVSQSVAATAATSGINYIAIANADGGDTYAGTAGNGVYIFGAQLEALAFPTSYIATAGATGSRSADTFSFPFGITPQEMTVYARFVEAGTFRNQTDGGRSPRIMQIGKSDDTGARLVLFAAQGGVGYNGSFTRDGSAFSSPALAHSHAVGDLVELMLQLAPDGSLTLRKAINLGSETSNTATGGGPMPSAWSDTKLWLGNLGGSGASRLPLLALKIARGTQTMDTMRALL